MHIIQWLAIFNLIIRTQSLVCYNCSSTQRDWTSCGGIFASANLAFNGSRLILMNCTGENAMCFIRSWSARTHYAWIVQRGCYQTAKDDPLPKTMIIPTRVRTCKHERLVDAEYKVCLCQDDWCNRSTDVLIQLKYLPINIAFISLYSILIN